MHSICVRLPNKLFQPTTYTRHNAPAVQTCQYNGIYQHGEYKFLWFHVSAWPESCFPPCLGLRILTLASLRLTQSLNLPWASNSKDWPNSDLVAGTFSAAAGCPRMLGCATQEKLSRLKGDEDPYSFCTHLTLLYKDKLLSKKTPKTVVLNSGHFLKKLADLKTVYSCLLCRFHIFMEVIAIPLLL
jgi:hypothetical protein